MNRLEYAKVYGSPRHYHESTMHNAYPWGQMLAVEGALCPDGKRRNAWPSGDGTADTFFSIPAYVYAKGRRVYGYVTVETMEGFSTITDNDPATVKFVPYRYRRNAYLVTPADLVCGRHGVPIKIRDGQVVEQSVTCSWSDCTIADAMTVEDFRNREARED